MELPSIGLQCSKANCKQLDFLPFKCKCGEIFCAEHFNEHTLNCAAVCSENDANLERVVADYLCSHPSCNDRSYVPLLCEKCNKHFCVRHRHIGECGEKEPEVLAAELAKFAAPVQEFNKVKTELDKQLDERINQARKKPKTQQMANKVQLMRIKNKATGAKGIPTTDRVYFNIRHPTSIGAKVSPVFVAKTWTLGRVIDGVADECKIPNQNNQSNAPKLRLFHQSGELISKNLAIKLEALLAEQTIVDGEELMLEYI